jgi:hypothetical protein
MKWWFKPVFITICVIETSLGIYLGFRFYQRKEVQVLGSTSVSVIHKATNTSNLQSTLKYYYEPQSNSTEIDTTPWVKGKVVWTYNNDTLNDRFDYTLDKPPRTYRIIAIGDSFTFGDHVNTADSWPEKLEDFLNTIHLCPAYDKYEVLNLGLRGFDIQNMVERYRLRGAKYHPDLVIWVLISRDLSQVRELMNGRAEELYAQAVKNGTLDPRWPWTEPLKIAEEELHKKYTAQEIARMQDGFFSDFPRMYSGPVIVATLPSTEERYKLEMRGWTRYKANLYYYEDMPDIYDSPDLYFQGDYHPTVLAHELIARTFYKYIQKNASVFCK